MKLGVFGGTFDPIHLGHLYIAEEAREHLGLDEVLFIPAGQPWLKSTQRITEAHHRLTMAELAVAENPYFKVTDMEVRRAGPTYTVDTLELLRASRGKEWEFYLILGLDALKEFNKWQKAEQIMDLATIVGMTRPGVDNFDPEPLEAVKKGSSEKVLVVHGPSVDISGTDIRLRVTNGMTIKYRVPTAVEAYIYKHRLYHWEGVPPIV